MVAGVARQWAHRAKTLCAWVAKGGGNKTTKEQVFIDVVAFAEWGLTPKTHDERKGAAGNLGSRPGKSPG